MEGFPGAVFREFSKRGKAVAFVEQHSVSRDPGVGYTLQSASNSSASGVENRNEVSASAPKIAEPSFCNFIEGILHEFRAVY